MRKKKDYEIENRKLNVLVAQQQEQIAALREQLGVANGKVAQMGEKLMEADKNMVTANEKIENLTNDNKTLRSMVNRMAVEKTQVRKELAEVNAKYSNTFRGKMEKRKEAMKTKAQEISNKWSARKEKLVTAMKAFGQTIAKGATVTGQGVAAGAIVTGQAVAKGTQATIDATVAFVKVPAIAAGSAYEWGKQNSKFVNAMDTKAKNFAANALKESVILNKIADVNSKEHYFAKVSVASVEKISKVATKYTVGAAVTGMQKAWNSYSETFKKAYQAEQQKRIEKKGPSL